MAEIGAGCNEGLSGKALIFIALLAFACGIVSAQENLEQVIATKGNGAFESDYATRIIRFLKQSRELLARTVWPVRCLFILQFYEILRNFSKLLI